MTLLTLALIIVSAVAGVNTSGRVTGIAVDPSDPSGNTVYTSGANGGVWR
jgi:hypothetical protein